MVEIGSKCIKINGNQQADAIEGLKKSVLKKNKKQIKIKLSYLCEMVPKSPSWGNRAGRRLRIADDLSRGQF